MVLVSVLVSTLAERPARADEPSPGAISDDHGLVTPLVPAAATGPLRCE